MNTSEVLYRAADLIEERGWGQGADTWADHGQGLCLEGGILAASGADLGFTDPEFLGCPAYRSVLRYLEDRFAFEFSRVQYAGDPRLWDWNDEKGRTAAEVIEVLRAAAVIEAARESENAAYCA